MKRIQILLSTYNGESYLREQLDSFLELSNYEDVKVLIRDDGSTDGTRDILLEYRDAHGFELIFGENVGFVASMNLLVAARDTECEYFSFCDQDDKWLPEKLSLAVSALDGIEKTTPTLYSARSHIADSELNIIGATLNPKRRLSFYNAMLQNVCAGHCQVINSSLAELLSEHPTDAKCIYYDHWIYILATAFGRVIFDPACTTLYRQHGGNAIGYDLNAFQTVKNRIARVLGTSIAARFTEELTEFLLAYGEKMPEEYFREGEKFILKQRNFFTRLSYIFVSRAYRNSHIEGLFFRLMYLFGSYKRDPREYLKRKEALGIFRGAQLKNKNS